MKSGAEKEVKQGAVVFICSNRECDAVWNRDPQGHCPKCKKPDGGGWSCMHRTVSALPLATLIYQGAGTACEDPDGPGEEDGPWAPGWEKRCGK